MNLKTKPKRLGSAGFTLIELLVAMVIALVVMAGIFSTYRLQIRSAQNQRLISQMQQNARVALFYLKHSIRMSGYDPSRGANASLAGDFPAGYVALGGKMLANYLSFTADVGDGSGGDPNGQIDVDPDEAVAYRLNNGRLERTMLGGGWQPLVENVEALNFVYLNKDRLSSIQYKLSTGRALPPEEVKSIQICLVIRTSKQTVAPFLHTDTQNYFNLQGQLLLAARNDNFRRMRATTEIKLRNL